MSTTSGFKSRWPHQSASKMHFFHFGDFDVNLVFERYFYTRKSTVSAQEIGYSVQGFLKSVER